ncbi:MAG: type 4a pilus biogenesis protein PilO [Burkholderiaceae bacterium]|nr:type 4a pilus biogenesis protein PilO [Burkholderiaceae bacterium]
MNLSSINAQFQNIGKDPGAWPLVPKITALIGILVFISILGWLLYWSDQMETLKAAEDKEPKLKQDYQTKMYQAINLEELRKQKLQVTQYVAALEKQLPSKAEMDALLSDINQAGIGRGLAFELFKPGTAVLKSYYAELPIAIKVTGPYHDIGAFAADLAALSRIVTLNNMNLSIPQGSNQLTLDATAKTFRYLDAEEIAAQQAAAAAAAKKGQPAKRAESGASK